MTSEKITRVRISKISLEHKCNENIGKIAEIYFFATMKVKQRLAGKK
jgi:hypothetical protein